MSDKCIVRTSSIASTVTAFLFSAASATPATIHRPAAQASVASGNRGAVVLQSVDEPTWLAEAQSRLAALARLPDGWGGSEKPSERACDVAREIIGMMQRHGHRVLHIAPIADGGLALSYLDGDRSAYFDVYNEGGVVAVTCAGYGTTAQFQELPEAEAVAALASFLQFEDDAASAG